MRTRPYELVISYPIPVGLGKFRNAAIRGTDQAIVHHGYAFSGQAKGSRTVHGMRRISIAYPESKHVVLAIRSILKLGVPGMRFRAEMQT